MFACYIEPWPTQGCSENSPLVPGAKWGARGVDLPQLRFARLQPAGRCTTEWNWDQLIPNPCLDEWAMRIYYCFKLEFGVYYTATINRYRQHMKKSVHDWTDKLTKKQSAGALIWEPVVVGVEAVEVCYLQFINGLSMHLWSLSKQFSNSKLD